MAERVKAKEEKKIPSLNTNVDKATFNFELKVDTVITDNINTYVYKVSQKPMKNTQKTDNKFYMIKGYKLLLDDWSTADPSVSTLREFLINIDKIYQEYYFAKIASLFSQHFCKAFGIGSCVKKAGSSSNLYIEILFEYAGETIFNYPNMTFSKAYDFMRQSANAIAIIHGVGVAHFDIKPENLTYDNQTDLVKIIDMGSTYGFTTKKMINAPVMTFGRRLEYTAEYSAPEIIQKETGKKPLYPNYIAGAVDIYCWGMSFYAKLLNKNQEDLYNDYSRYKKDPIKDAEKK